MALLEKNIIDETAKNKLKLHKITEEMIKNFIKEANDNLKNAYVPYSKFPVSALLIDNNDNKHFGTNIENASFGLTICAERNVIPTAVHNGMKTIKLLVVTGNTPDPISPCGACRQVISEFSNENTVIILTNKNGDFYTTSKSEILPYFFGPNDL